MRLSRPRFNERMMLLSELDFGQSISNSSIEPIDSFLIAPHTMRKQKCKLTRFN